MMRESKCPFMRITFFLLSLLVRASDALTPALSFRRAVATATPQRSRSLGVSACHNGHRFDADKHAADGNGEIMIVGAGWVGSRLATHLHDRGELVRVTNRPGIDQRHKEPYFEPVPLADDVPRHEFDITDPTTWDSLPAPETLQAAVVTFATKTGTCELFWEQYLQYVPRVVCYSSTAVYQVGVPGQHVDEHTPLRDSPRALAETYMQERGATVLTIAGIFGEAQGARGVCNCLTSYVQSGAVLNGGKIVNMVHVDDIIAATAAVLALPADAERGVRMNIGGHDFKLRELMAHCRHVATPEVMDSDDPNSKLVSSNYLLNRVLPPGFAFKEPFLAPVPYAVTK